MINHKASQSIYFLDIQQERLCEDGVFLKILTTPYIIISPCSYPKSRDAVASKKSFKLNVLKRSKNVIHRGGKLTLFCTLDQKISY